MQLSNFKNALSSLARKNTTELKISDSFTLHVQAMRNDNRTFAHAKTMYVKQNPKHRMVTDADNFTLDLLDRNITEDIKHYLAHLVVTDWYLLDDDNKKQAFSPAECIDLFNLPDVGERIAAKVIDTALNETSFDIDWESVVTKNS